VCFQGRVVGMLALVVPEGDGSVLEAGRVLLGVCARALAARLEIEALTEAAAANARLADVGEVSASLAHEFNNFLNALMLHLAFLKRKLREGAHPAGPELGQQAVARAALVQEFQGYRRGAAAAARPLDLN